MCVFVRVYVQVILDDSRRTEDCSQSLENGEWDCIIYYNIILQYIGIY